VVSIAHPVSLNGGITSDLVLGIDAGGTKTVAWLATGEGNRIGQGLAGPGNPRAVGFDRACEQLRLAVDAAFADAKQPRTTVAAAVIGMAGADRPDDAQRIIDWAAAVSLATQVQVTNDALPVIAAGTPAGWGVALIAGTGSIAVALAPDGRQSRAGGWGYLFGDEGSAYAIALAGLRAAAQSIDGILSPSTLVPKFLDRLRIQKPPELVSAIYRTEMDRPAIAALADVVLAAAAEGDGLATSLLDRAAQDLANMVIAAAGALKLREFPVALTGGLLVHSPVYRDMVVARLREHPVEEIGVVPDPVAGAVKLALRLFGRRSGNPA
jgi:N-acetylmuramic acid 6-phosphate etherase